MSIKLYRRRTPKAPEKLLAWSDQSTVHGFRMSSLNGEVLNFTIPIHDEDSGESYKVEIKAALARELAHWILDTLTRKVR